ncbi:MAG TPA: thiamine pyrophosphate-binding protein [Hyphomicrobiaceae bacterium]|nr:thiamine pyrophosphate-binding protein [Hyphomicrobiaceae bacterium]
MPDAPAEPITGAEWLARTIHATGTTHVFWIDAVLRRTLIELGVLGVTRVLAHTEKSAVYMADGYARIAGRPGICFAQSVGAANLAAGLQDPYLGRSPVIALTGRKIPSLQHRNAYQELPHAPLFTAVTKFAAEVDSAADLPRLFRQAWRAAMTGSPRPVHLDLNGRIAEVVEMGQVSEPVSAASPLDMRMPPHRPAPPADDISRAAKAILAAKRVAIIAGAGATASNCGAELLTLGERLAAPIGVSLGAYGLIPTRHKLAIGTVGDYAAPPANRIVHEADLVLFVGCHTGDQVTYAWRIPPIDTPVVQIDVDPIELGRSYPNTLGLMGDPKTTLALLTEAIGKPARDSAYAESAARRMSEWRAERAPLLASNSAPILPDRLCAEISKALPADAILVADTGYSGIWTSTLVDLNGAGQTYLRAAGSLGWAFPASLGAKCAAPHRKVVCYSGDGALYYHLTELETAKRRGIAVTLVVNNNSGFGQGWPNLVRQQGNKPGDPAEMLRFGPTDFAAIARGFGVRAIRVEDPAKIGAALAEAIAADETVVVDVVTDIEARAPAPWLPEGAA